MVEVSQIRELIDALGWTLIHFLWQGCVIVAVYWLASRLTRPDQAQARYWAGLLAYLAAAAAPAVTLGLYLQPAVGAGSAVAMALPSLTVVTGYHYTAGRMLQEALEPSLPLVVALWAVGVAVLSSRTFLGWLGTRRLVRFGVKPVPAEVRELVLRCRQRLAVTRAVRVLCSVRVGVPTVVGWLKPVILLPVGVIAGLPTAQLEMIIAHELAHVRRNDYLVNLLQIVVETLFFYHPAIRWLSGQVRKEREHCCDDLVLSRCGRPIQYARALARLEALRETPRAPALGANGGDLYERVRRIVRRELPRSSSGHVQVLLAAAVAIAASLGSHQALEMGLANRQAASGQPAATAGTEFPALRDRIALGEGLLQHDENLRRDERRKTASEDAAGEPLESAAKTLLSPAASPTRQPNSKPPVSDPALATGTNPDRQPPPNPAPEISYERPVLMLASAAPSTVAQGDQPPGTGDTAGDGEASIRPLLREAPAYPYAAHRQGIEGSVKLQFTVDARGRVQHVRVIDAYPQRVFEEAAVKALKKWRFEVQEGRDPSQPLFQTFEFTLTDAAPTALERAPSRRCSRTGSNICGRHFSADSVELFSNASND